MATEATPSGGQPAATPPGAPGHHDWHSPAYVQDWVARYEARAGHREAQFDLLADLIPHPAGAPLRILDVGAGWGPVTRHLLFRFPAARAVLLDFSAPMLAEARERLAGVADRVSFVVGDLSRPGAVATARAAGTPGGEPDGAPFDAAVSSLCVHNLRPAERVRELFGEIHDVLAPGGCFLDLDLMGAGAPAVRDAWQRVRVQELRRERLASTGTMPAFEEALALLQAQGEARQGGAGRGASGAPAAPPPAQGGGGAGGAPARTLLDHLLWLREAGFDAAECFWRHERQALIGGYKSPSAPGAPSRPSGGAGG